MDIWMDGTFSDRSSSFTSCSVLIAIPCAWLSGTKRSMTINATSTSFEHEDQDVGHDRLVPYEYGAVVVHRFYDS
jgi:hypothetical protein